jgi:DNA-binding GntR family transcriptional regulator
VAILNVKSLREQVYEYIRDQMMTGQILRNTTLNLNEISDHLEISKTPLRDALIRLEVEGFVTIMPRRGVVVNALTLQDVKDFYQICGALEGDVVRDVFDQFDGNHISVMRQLNSDMRAAIQRDEFDLMYRLNIRFHDVFLKLSDNTSIRSILMPLKQRLYDFQRRPYVKEWELRNTNEHDQFIDAIKKREREEAVRLLRDVHWSFRVQEDYIRTFHRREAELNGKQIGLIR